MKDTDLTLEQAQQSYGRGLVPWILDNKDLMIINSIRSEAKKQTGSCMSVIDTSSTFGRSHDINEILRKRLWHGASLETT